MKLTRIELHPQFITDVQGKKTSVVLDISEYERLLDRLEDLTLGALATTVKHKERSKGSHSLEDVKREIKESKKKQKKVSRT